MINPTFTNVVHLLTVITIAIVGVAVLERLPIGWSPHQRSWLWRAVFVKACLLVLIPVYLTLPIAVPLPNNLSMLIGNSDLAMSTPATGVAIETTSLDPEASVLSSNDRASSRGSIWIMAIVAAWLIGPTVCWIAWIQRHLRMRRLLALQACSPDEQLRRIYTQTAKAMQVAPPRLKLCRIASGPALMWGPPTQLLLPIDLADRFGSEACRMAIAHELGHHRRRDLYWNFLATAMFSLLYFWPPIWYAMRRYNLAMEEACDALAVRRCSLDRMQYASLLVELAGPLQPRSRSSAILSMARSGSFHSLAQRIQSMRTTRNVRRIYQPLTSLAAGLTVLLVIAPLSFVRAQDTQSTKPKIQPDTRAAGTSQSSAASGNSQSQGSTVVSGSAMAGGFARGGSSGFSSAGGGGSAGGVGTAISGVQLGVGTSPAQQPNKYAPNSGGVNTFGSNSGVMSGSTQNGISVTRSQQNNNGSLTDVTNIKTRSQEVEIRESSDDGIRVRIRELRRGNNNEPPQEFASPDRETLEKDHPAAYRWVKRYAPKGAVAAGNPLPQLTPDNQVNAMPLAPDASTMMRQQIQQMIDQNPDNPVLRAQLQEMLKNLP